MKIIKNIHLTFFCVSFLGVQQNFDVLFFDLRKVKKLLITQLELVFA